MADARSRRSITDVLREATENLWLSAFYRRGISLLRLCVHIALGATFLFLQRPGEREKDLEMALGRPTDGSFDI